MSNARTTPPLEQLSSGQRPQGNAPETGFTKRDPHLPRTFPAQSLYGRNQEQSRIAALLTALMSTRGGALLIRGGAGMGKSALIAHSRRTAEALGIRVLQTTGVHAEMRLPFSGLHQLVRPIREIIDRIPSGQQDVINLALGRRNGVAPNLYAVALAILELFAEAAQDAPLLILADDAHWLDRSTLDVLAFVARRLDSEPAAIIFATRTESQNSIVDAAVEVLDLKPLDHVASRALLHDHGAQLSEGLQSRLLDEAAGHPLALVEMPSTWAALGDQYFDRPSHALPLTSRLEEAFSARMAEMPTPTLVLLLAAATDPGCTSAELIQIAQLVTNAHVGLEHAEPAIAAGILVSNHDGLTFRHPLMRSAVYTSSTLIDRIAVHAALAEVLKDDLDRSVWHRAYSTLGVDESVATELEEFARRAQNRGAIAVSVSGLENAAGYTQGSRRASLLLEAGALACDLGRYTLAQEIIARVESDDLGLRDRARLVAVRELSGTGTVTYEQPLTALIDAATMAREAEDIHLATSLLWMAASRCWWTSAEPSEREAVAVAADELELDNFDVRLVTIQGYASPLKRGRSGLASLSEIKPRRGDLDELRFNASAAFILCDYPRSRRTFEATISVANAQGRLGLMPRLLVVGGWSTVWTGKLDDVLVDANRAEDLGREIGDNVWAVGAKALAAIVWGMQGDYERCVAEVLHAQSEPVLRRAPFLYSISQQIRAIGALSVGRYEEAWAQLMRVSAPSDPAYHHDVQFWLCSDIADAGVGSGRMDEARALLAQLEIGIVEADWPWCLIGLRYARAVLASKENAERLFAEALAHDLSDWPWDRARLELSYGNWLASRGDRAGARDHLTAAEGGFSSVGATAWSAKAAEALRRAGGTVSEPRQQAVSELSAHELNIARLAASGLTNRQIAQRLFISHRTVASHLYRVFPKLGISTRAQLADALRELNVR